MKTIQINNIKRRPYNGLVYNVELNTNSETDDLFWIEQNTNIAGHNCFPKDICALIHQLEESGFDPKMLKACWDQNKTVRPDMDWGRIPGAVSRNTP